MSKLPIHSLQADLLAAVKAESPVRLVLDAPTGSGKSTQVPQMLVDSGLVEGEVLVLQPRRLAARLLANRVAFERGGVAGREVGYRVRFDDRTSSQTRIVYMTEGILLRRLLDDPDLKGVGAVLFDEFHERHVFSDIALARVMQLQGRRSDLKLVVMSATLDSEALEAYLSPCVRLQSAGRTFPVEISHTPLKQRINEEVWDAAVRAIEESVLAPGLDGDVLVFMPGGFEIQRTLSALRAKSWTSGWQLLPLYGELPPDKQDAAVRGYRERKIVVATNVAETSVTIDGVRAVIDSGLARMADFDPRRGINTLTVQKISRASADQRAGRAGRTSDGICVRLWSQTDHGRRAAQQAPEIRRLDLCETVLYLKTQGVESVEDFPWLDAPDAAAMERAVTLLRNLGALDHDGGITDLGRRMARFPVHPRQARILIAAGETNCLEEAARCVAICQGRGLFVRGRHSKADRTREELGEEWDISDFEVALRAFQLAERLRFEGRACGEHGIHGLSAREAAKTAKDLLRLAERQGLERNEYPANPEDLARALLAGFSDHLAKRRGKATASCAVVGGRRGTLAKECVLRDAELFVAAEITEIEGRELTVVLNQATAIEEAWLEAMFPDDFREGTAAVFDATARRVVCREQRWFRDLLLSEKARGEVSDEQAAELLAGEVAAGNLLLKKWDGAVEQWVARLNCLAEWMPELELPPIDDEARRLLLTQVCMGARSYKELKDRAVWPVLKTWLSAPQKVAVEQWAPERIELSNGRSAKVRYAVGEAPKIGMVLQRLYDVNVNPMIADGRVPVVVEILAPNQRPVQVTADLAGFWENGYAAVKSQLKGRYPKHEWR